MIHNLSDDELDALLGERIPEHRGKSFVNDPAMSMMLLQLPGFVSMCFIDEDNAYDVTFCGAKVHNLDCGAKMVTLIRPKLGRCIAECFALSLGDEPK